MTSSSPNTKRVDILSEGWLRNQHMVRYIVKIVIVFTLFFLLLLSEYIQELLMKTIELCESDATEQQSSILPEPLSSGYEHPPKLDAIRRHKSRFKNI